MNFDKNMQFEIKNGFLPNLNKSDTLTVLEVTENNIVIQMNKSTGRGVFPSESLQYWIKRGLLIQMDGEHKRTS